MEEDIEVIDEKTKKISEKLILEIFKEFIIENDSIADEIYSKNKQFFELSLNLDLENEKIEYVSMYLSKFLIQLPCYDFETNEISKQSILEDFEKDKNKIDTLKIQDEIKKMYEYSKSTFQRKNQSERNIEFKTISQIFFYMNQIEENKNFMIDFETTWNLKSEKNNKKMDSRYNHFIKKRKFKNYSHNN